MTIDDDATDCGTVTTVIARDINVHVNIAARSDTATVARPLPQLLVRPQADTYSWRSLTRCQHYRAPLLVLGARPRRWPLDLTTLANDYWYRGGSMRSCNCCNVRWRFYWHDRGIYWPACGDQITAIVSGCCGLKGTAHREIVLRH